MSKITIITGSPRKDSNFNQMAQWFNSLLEMPRKLDKYSRGYFFKFQANFG